MTFPNPALHPSQFVWYNTFAVPETKVLPKINYYWFKNNFHFLIIAQKYLYDSIQNPRIIFNGNIKYVWIVIRYDNVLVFTPLRAELVTKFSGLFGDKLSKKFCDKLGEKFCDKLDEKFCD